MYITYEINEGCTVYIIQGGGGVKMIKPPAPGQIPVNAISIKGLYRRNFK